jgi:WhiB family transcriptional regulator, redox-sensing transcriptional regulator
VTGGRGIWGLAVDAAPDGRLSARAVCRVPGTVGGTRPERFDVVTHAVPETATPSANQPGADIESTRSVNADGVRRRGEAPEHFAAIVELAVAGRERASTAWTEQAACRGVDVKVFFPETTLAAAAALERCGECTVWRECLAAAIVAGDVGVWGGTLDSDRRRVLLRLRASGFLTETSPSPLISWDDDRSDIPDPQLSSAEQMENQDDERRPAQTVMTTSAPGVLRTAPTASLAPRRLAPHLTVSHGPTSRSPFSSSPGGIPVTAPATASEPASTFGAHDAAIPAGSTGCTAGEPCGSCGPCTVRHDGSLTGSEQVDVPAEAFDTVGERWTLLLTVEHGAEVPQVDVPEGVEMLWRSSRDGLRSGYARRRQVS